MWQAECPYCGGVFVYPEPARGRPRVIETILATTKGPQRELFNNEVPTLAQKEQQSEP
jgi:hypothetical protein